MSGRLLRRLFGGVLAARFDPRPQEGGILFFTCWFNEDCSPRIGQRVSPATTIWLFRQDFDRARLREPKMLTCVLY